MVWPIALDTVTVSALWQQKMANTKERCQEMIDKKQLQKITLAAQEVDKIATSPHGFPEPEQAKEIQLFVSKCHLAMDAAARAGAFRCTVTFDAENADKRFMKEVKYALREFNPTLSGDDTKKVLSLCWE